MQSYTAKPAKPVTVQAVQYEAPNGTDVAGNVDEIKSVADAREQNPWDPRGGQHSLVIVAGDVVRLLESGSYLVFNAGGVGIMTEADFHGAYDLVAETKAN